MQTIMTSLIFNVILTLVLVLAMPYVKFGLSVLWAKMLWKSNASLISIRSRANNFPLPYTFDNSKDSFKKKIGGQVLTFPINRNDKPALTMLGMSWYIRDIEDASNEIGLMYLNSQGDITVVKEPDYIRSEEIEIILNNQKLMSTVKTLLDNYQIIFIVVIALAIIGLFNAYVSWETLQFINDFGGLTQ